MIFRTAAVAVTAMIVACEGGSAKTSGPGNTENPDPSTPAIGPLLTQPSGSTVTINVDAALLRQEMHGFGTSMRIFSDPHLIGQLGSIENSLEIGISDQDSILAVLYDKIGLTRVRPLSLAGGVQPSPFEPPRTDWVFADGHIELVKRARTFGLRDWWLSPLTLEKWMSGETAAADYAAWAMRAIRYWKSQGAEPTWFSVLNEPSNLAVNVSGEFLRDATKLLGQQLAAEGFNTRIVIPDDVDPAYGAQKARIILADPEARKYVGALAVHLYGDGVQQMSQISALAAEYGLPLWMSEYSVGNSSPLNWAELMHFLIADHNVSAVDYMWGFFGDFDGSQLVSIRSSSRKFTGYTLVPSAYAMAQYAKYVRPGARRVQVTSSAPHIKATAFIRDGKITIVVINSGGNGETGRFNIAGAPQLRRLNLVRTSSSESLLPIGHLEVENDVFRFQLPARSISTFVQ